MAITACAKQTSTRTLPRGGTFRVTLSLRAAPERTAGDRILLLDCSGSMDGPALSAMQQGVRDYLRRLLAAGGRAGLIVFACEAEWKVPLTRDPTPLLAALDSLTALGPTNQAAALSLALPEAGPETELLLITDGISTVGTDPRIPAAAIRDRGSRLHVIALTGNEGLNREVLASLCSQPESRYLHLTDDPDALLTLPAETLCGPGASHISIRETVAEDFAIVSLEPGYPGRAELLDDRTLCWTIPCLGVCQEEDASLTFTLRHRGRTCGELPVNESLVYRDDQNSRPEFGSPSVYIIGCEDFREPCGSCLPVCLPGCEQTVCLDAGALPLCSGGRLILVSTRIPCVCPGRDIALAAILEDGTHMLAMKTFRIPGHPGPGCREVQVNHISFILPETPCGLCDCRCLRVRLLAHYLGGSLPCCP